MSDEHEAVAPPAPEGRLPQPAPEGHLAQANPEAQRPQPAPEGQPGPPDPGGHPTQPTLWPVTVGAGVTLLLFGVLGGWLFSLAGLALLFLGVGGWIGELRGESGHRGGNEVGRERAE